jgi:hypothetical protein
MARRVSLITRGTGQVGALLIGPVNPILIFTGAVAPTDGTTGANEAAPGSKYTDYVTGVEYINTGTKASPTWQPMDGGAGETREVRNASGSSIAAGKLVYLSGWNETEKLPTITLADADAGGARAQYVTLATIANNANGLAVQKLRLTGQATNGRTVGDPAYLSTTAGGYTFTIPAGDDDLVQIVGRVAVVHASTGVVEFDIRDPQKIGTNEIEDSAITAAKVAAAAGNVVASEVVKRDAGSRIPLLMAAPAAAGNSQGTATQLAAQANYVTGADGTTGVILPVGVADMQILVVNTVTTAAALLKVYPDAGGAINGGSANAAFSVAPGEAAIFSCSAALTWKVAPQAAAFDVTGVGAGYKLARTEMALDGGNPTSWAHGLTTVIAAGCSLKGSVAPGLGTCLVTAVINGAAIDFYAWKPTGAGDCTLIASTGTESIYAWAIGT